MNGEQKDARKQLLFNEAQLCEETLRTIVRRMAATVDDYTPEGLATWDIGLGEIQIALLAYQLVELRIRFIDFSTQTGDK